MLVSPLVAIAVVGGAVALVSMLWDEKKPTGELRARARPPLTELEQRVYWRLKEAFPGTIVLAQVALSSLMTTPRKDRSRWYHKVVDFVILDRAFNVHAIIEIDDESEASRHTVGEPVRRLLELAGYRVFEFNAVPDVETLHREVGKAPVPQRHSNT
jgi:hypothetical protein